MVHLTSAKPSLYGHFFHTMSLSLVSSPARGKHNLTKQAGKKRAVWPTVRDEGPQNTQKNPRA